MVVYKYRPVDKYTLELLINNELYFSFPEDFNDPFDSYINWNYKATVSQYKDWVENRQDFPTKMKKKFKKLVDENKINSEIFHEYFSKTDKTKLMLVYSLSEINNNILMWSHYANKHKGIVLGFKAKENYLFEFEEKIDLHNVFKKGINCYPLFKVLYNNINLTANYFNTEYFEYLKYITKAENWEYESERRLVLNAKDFECNGIIQKNFKFNKKMLKEIIFGLWTSQEDKKTIRSIIKDKGYDVKFFQCQRKKDEYGLDIVPA